MLGSEIEGLEFIWDCGFGIYGLRFQVLGLDDADRLAIVFLDEGVGLRSHS